MTEEAVDRGAFGAPTMFFTEEDQEEQMFWGSDRSHTNPFQYLKCSVYNCTSTYCFYLFRFDMIAHCFDKQWLGPDPGK